MALQRDTHGMQAKYAWKTEEMLLKDVRNAEGICKKYAGNV